MNKWTLTESMNYCKGKLSEGKPIIVKNFKNGKEVNTDKWVFRGYNNKMKPVKFECTFTMGLKKDKHGARVKLLKYEQ